MKVIGPWVGLTAWRSPNHSDVLLCEGQGHIAQHFKVLDGGANGNVAEVQLFQINCHKRHDRLAPRAGSQKQMEYPDP